MKSYKIVIIFLSILFSVSANSSELIDTSAIKSAKVHVKGQVLQAVEHNDISCLFISSSKLDKNGAAIPWSHEDGGDVMACSDKPLDYKSFKNKFVSITAEFVSMNHNKNNLNLESYPIVKIKHIEKLNFNHASYTAVNLPVGYHDPGFYVKTR